MRLKLLFTILFLGLAECMFAAQPNLEMPHPRALPRSLPEAIPAPDPPQGQFQGGGGGAGLPAGVTSPGTGSLTGTGTATFNIGSFNSVGTNFEDMPCAAQSVGNSNQVRYYPDATCWPVVSMNTNAAQKLALSMGVNAQTIGYTATQSDCGKLITMNGVSLTLTLPAAIINSACVFDVKNLAATSLTIARNGLNVDGAASNPTALTQNQSYRITNDGAGYWTEALLNTTGTVTTTGSPASSFCAYFSGATSIIGTANCTLDSNGNLTPVKYATATNCSSSASPAVCGSAAAGSVAVPTGVTPTLVVNTTAVTANSQILFTPDESLGTKLSVTCNSTIAQVAIEPIVTARTAATSFTIQYNTTITVNPICLSYWIVN